VNATAVAELDRGTLAAKKNAFRENLWRNVRGLENHLLACGGRVVALTAWRCRRGKLRSTSGRKTKNLLNRIMETLWGCGNRTTFSFVPEKRNEGHRRCLRSHAFREQKSAKEPKGWCAILRARPRGCHKGEDKDAGSAKFHEGVLGMGLAGTLFPGVLWAQAQAQGAAKITKED